VAAPEEDDDMERRFGEPSFPLSACKWIIIVRFLDKTDRTLIIVLSCSDFRKFRDMFLCEMPFAMHQFQAFSWKIA
jgi:hypothetical protein